MLKLRRAVVARSTGRDKALDRAELYAAFAEHVGSWECVGARATPDACEGCGAGGGEALHALQNTLNKAELEACENCVARFESANLKERAAELRTLACAAGVAKNFPACVLKAAQKNGWIASRKLYGTCPLATRATDQTLRRVLRAGALFKDARPLRRVYRLVGPPLNSAWSKALGVKHSEERGAFWRGCEECAPPDVANCITGISEIAWEAVWHDAPTREP
jgi:hypothetical protein